MNTFRGLLTNKWYAQTRSREERAELAAASALFDDANFGDVENREAPSPVEVVGADVEAVGEAAVADGLTRDALVLSGAAVAVEAVAAPEPTDDTDEDLLRSPFRNVSANRPSFAVSPRSSAKKRANRTYQLGVRIPGDADESKVMPHLLRLSSRPKVVKKQSYTTSRGVEKVFYACDLATSCGCPFMLAVERLPGGDGNVLDTVVSWSGHHEHSRDDASSSSSSSARGLTSLQKEYLQPLVVAGTPPARVHALLIEASTVNSDLLPVPDSQVVRNFIYNNATKFREQAGAATLEGFKDFCEEHKLPEDADTFLAQRHRAYVVDFKLDSLNDFSILISTPHLLSNRLVQPYFSAPMVSVDATYKLNWNGFPVIAVGNVDVTQSYHAIAHAIVYSEQTKDYKWVLQTVESTVEKFKAALWSLRGHAQPPRVQLHTNMSAWYVAADSADAIKNAASEVYTPIAQRLDAKFVVITCAAHFSRALKNTGKSKLVNKDNYEEVKSDINHLALVPYPFSVLYDFLRDKLEQEYKAKAQGRGELRCVVCLALGRQEQVLVESVRHPWRPHHQQWPRARQPAH